MDGEGGFNLGRSSEILRDELKFTKFVGRLRKRFSNMFNDMLKTQLILKNVITPEDWESMSEHIQYDFLYDNHFSELKESELLNERLVVFKQQNLILESISHKITFVVRSCVKQMKKFSNRIDSSRKKLKTELFQILYLNQSILQLGTNGSGQPVMEELDSRSTSTINRSTRITERRRDLI